MKFKKIIENNQKWIEDHLKLDPDYFTNLSKGQSPEVLYIGCSDSRVTAEEIIGARPGEVFVHRNIANIVTNSDVNVMSVINYAVVHLKVKHIVVCGHYYCGGVKAAMQATDLGILNLWLRNIRDVYRLHKEELKAIKDEELRYKRLVELNVQEQCVNILKTIEVQQAYREYGISIHGWVFDIKTGKIIDLKIDFANVLKGLWDIYDYTAK
ncbi:MAG: carbonic anhydrase [Cyclobacteriaceae bacterium]|nr:carbonic anhydrase [Cyclobacteriaceae bacterium]